MSTEGEADVHAPWRKQTWHRRLIRGNFRHQDIAMGIADTDDEVELHSCQGQRVSAERGDELVTFWQRIHANISDHFKHLLVAGGLQLE